MRHLAGTGDRPAIGVVKSVADLAFHDAAGIIYVNQFQAIRATVFFFLGKLKLRFMWGGMLDIRGRMCNRCGFGS
jgi:hypothetical protein